MVNRSSTSSDPVHPDQVPDDISLRLARRFRAPQGGARRSASRLSTIASAAAWVTAPSRSCSAVTSAAAFSCVRMSGAAAIGSSMPLTFKPSASNADNERADAVATTEALSGDAEARWRNSRCSGPRSQQLRSRASGEDARRRGMGFGASACATRVLVREAREVGGHRADCQGARATLFRGYVACWRVRDRHSSLYRCPDK